MLTRKTHVILLALAAVILGFTVGRPLFLPALKLLFADWFQKLPEYSDAEKASASWNFCLSFMLFSAMIPLSALVTERFAAQAVYSHALMKSLLVGALAFGAGAFYQLHHLASLERLSAKLGQPIGALAARLTENPLAKVVWFSGICLVIFGPLDLWIARVQKQWRKPAAETPAEKAVS